MRGVIISSITAQILGINIKGAYGVQYFNILSNLDNEYVNDQYV